MKNMKGLITYLIGFDVIAIILMVLVNFEIKDGTAITHSLTVYDHFRLGVLSIILAVLVMVYIALDKISELKNKLESITKTNEANEYQKKLNCPEKIICECKCINHGDNPKAAD
jgi:hypothetical protein